MKFLNVGGASKEHKLPGDLFKDWEQVLLDIDPTGEPDLLWDARKLYELDPEQFEGILCSHNLEHYNVLELQDVIKGFKHVLKPKGIVVIVVPNLLHLFKTMLERGHDLYDIYFMAMDGTAPIMYIDVIYGHSGIICQGNQYYQHKYGFTPSSLDNVMQLNGFYTLHCEPSDEGYDVLYMGGKI